MQIQQSPYFTLNQNFQSKEKNGRQPLQVCMIDQWEPGINPFVWIEGHRADLQECLHNHGGILLRNLPIHSISEFNRLVQIFSPNLLDYVYRSTPRTKLGGKIYTATEYPANRVIPMHNENSYSHQWPHQIFFFSLIVADTGGQTPIADSHRVYNKIDPTIRKKFEEHGVLYVRNYSPGVDLSWQEVFCTQSKEEVARFCVENGIQFEWKSGNTELTTRQICQASLVHPKTKATVWFNQAHLFHISALTPSERETLIEQLGEDNVPRNTYYGNGEKIEPEVLDHIRQVYEEEKIVFNWQRGDVMILDNILMAHSREKYTGERKIAVAMV